MNLRAAATALTLWAAVSLGGTLLEGCAAPGQIANAQVVDALVDSQAAEQTKADADAQAASADAAEVGPLGDVDSSAAAHDGATTDSAGPDSEVASGTDAGSGPDAGAAPDAGAGADADADTAIDASPPKPAPWTLASAAAALDSGSAAQVQDLLSAYDMPLCAAGSCLFLVQAPQAKTVDVMGDWGNWTQGNALSPAVKAKGWFSGKVAVDHSNVREYKLQIDGIWTLDPSNPYFRFGGFGPNSAIFPASHSRLRLIGQVASPQLGNNRSLYVYLPAAYFSSPDQHFPVLYWHDGLNVFTNPKAPFGDWKVDAVADALIAQGAIAPLVQVGIDTDDRMSEYVWAPLEYQKKVYAPKIAKYAAFLVDTVKPLIDKTFRTLPDRDHTALAGSSLGGNASLWIGWQHWKIFGRIASFSGALWIGEGASSGSGTTGSGPALRDIIAQNATGVPKGALRIYLDSGDRDFDDSACYECDSWVYSDWTRNALIAAGWTNRAEWDTDGNLATPPANLAVSTAIAKVPSLAWSNQPPAGKSWQQWLGLGNNLLSLVGHGHQHSEPAWNQRAPVALRYLFGGP